MADIAAAHHELTDSKAIRHIPIVAFGWSLAFFAMLTYSLCVALMFVVPDQGLHRVWLQFLPFFQGLNWTSYLIGLAEVFVYSWYVAGVFGLIYNFFAKLKTA